jgi:hypothetical protein
MDKSFISEKTIIIQRYVRGFLFRIKRLPIILYSIQKYLLEIDYQFCNLNNDGRINSNFDEENIINILITKFEWKIKKPRLRNWFDICVFDNYYGWLPVNIKSTSTKTSDNVGNLALAVYSYTNADLDLNNGYENGNMADLLFNKLKNNEINYVHKKDYYFLVLNKNNNKQVIINSVKGLSKISPNINNLPFQVKWDVNQEFEYKHIRLCISDFLGIIKRSNMSWKETFLQNVRNYL